MSKPQKPREWKRALRLGWRREKHSPENSQIQRPENSQIQRQSSMYKSCPRCHDPRVLQGLKERVWPLKLFFFEERVVDMTSFQCIPIGQEGPRDGVGRERVVGWARVGRRGVLFGGRAAAIPWARTGPAAVKSAGRGWGGGRGAWRGRTGPAVASLTRHAHAVTPQVAARHSAP